jgi:hypothetical protein
MGLKVLGIPEWLVFHVLLIAGLVLLTVGLLQDIMALNVAGIWVIAVGLCVVFSTAFRKLSGK